MSDSVCLPRPGPERPYSWPEHHTWAAHVTWASSQPGSLWVVRLPAWKLRTPSARVATSQLDSALPFMTQPWKSNSSYHPTSSVGTVTAQWDSERKERAFISQWEDCPGHVEWGTTGPPLKAQLATDDVNRMQLGWWVWSVTKGHLGLCR